MTVDNRSDEQLAAMDERLRQARAERWPQVYPQFPYSEPTESEKMQVLLEDLLTEHFAKHREPLAFRVGLLMAMAACIAIQVYLLMVSEVAR